MYAAIKLFCEVFTCISVFENEYQYFAKNPWHVHADEHRLDLNSVKMDHQKTLIFASHENEVLFLSCCVSKRFLSDLIG